MTDASIDLNKAAILIDAGRPEDGLEIARSHLEVHPESAHAMCLVAIALLTLRRLQGAFDAARSAVATAPDWDTTWRVASSAAQELGAWDDALSSARTAIRLNPEFWQNHLQLAVVGIARSKVNSECMSAAHRAVELAPDEPDAHSTLAGAYLGKRKVAAAKASVRAALALDPQNARAIHLHSLLAMTINPGASAASFANRLSEAPTDADARDAFRGAAFVVLGQMHAIIALVIVALARGQYIAPSLYPTPREILSMPDPWVRAVAFVFLIACLAGYIVWLKRHAGSAFSTLVRGLPQLDRSLVVRAALLAMCIVLLGVSVVFRDGTVALYSIVFCLGLGTVVYVVQERRQRGIVKRKLKAERARI